MRIVAALGGNALLRRGQTPDSDIQQAHVEEAVAALAPLAADHDLIITHGNGPQVGVLANESARDPSLTHPYPFDVLTAQTQGMIGYWLLQALHTNLPDRRAAALISRTLIAADDPALAHPTKFVGPVFDQATAQRLAAERGWDVAPDGPAWRRVVPSPRPLDIIDLPLISDLIDGNTVVVCAGGGGAAVAQDGQGRLHGVEAIVDKDLVAALLARSLKADALLLLTDVPAVIDHYGTPDAQPIRRATPRQMRERSFPSGSMGPKVEGACEFVEDTGGFAAIGTLQDAPRLAAQTAGTIITPH